VRNNYQSKKHKSNHNFGVVRVQEELLVRVPLPMAEVWAEMQAQVEELTNFESLTILGSRIRSLDGLAPLLELCSLRSVDLGKFLSACGIENLVRLG
jgi:hypothetical protein